MDKTTDDAAVAAACPYSIHLSSAGKLNLADFQNSVPFLRELAVVNDSNREIAGLQLRLTSVPPFLKPRTWAIDACEAGTSYAVKECDVQLDGAMLARLTEAELATVSFTLVSTAQSGEEQTLCVREQPVELLPRNQ